MEVLMSTRDEAEEESEISRRGYRGLCSACRKGEQCTYPRDYRHPILQCEEFEGIEPSAVRFTEKDILQAIDSIVKLNCEENNSNQYQGLCRNCQIREHCTYPRPEGGVWHCEEYR